MPLLALRRQLGFASGLLVFPVMQCLELSKAGDSVGWLAHLEPHIACGKAEKQPPKTVRWEKQPGLARRAFGI
jgi:hypothetical protein